MFNMVILSFFSYKFKFISKGISRALPLLFFLLLMTGNIWCESSSFLLNENLIRNKITEIEGKDKEKAAVSGSIQDRFQYVELLFYESLRTGNEDWFSSCSSWLQNDFPDSDYAFQSAILYILTQMELNDFKKALHIGETYLDKYKDHPKKRELEALISYARARYLSRSSIRLNAIEECKNYLNNFSDQYHRKAVEAILSWNEAWLEYINTRKEYLNSDFRKAADIMFDYAEQYSIYSDLSNQAINRAFYALYYGKYYDEFLKRCNELEPWWFEQSWADDIVFLKAVIFVREGQGREARKTLDYFETNFPKSRLYSQLPQLRAESYIKGEFNLKETLISGPNEINNAFNALTNSLEDSLMANNNKRIKYNMNLLKILAENGNKEWEAIELIEQISKKYKLTPRQKFARSLTRAALLTQTGYLDLAEDELKMVTPLVSTLQEKGEIIFLKKKIKEMRKKSHE